jgi:SseB protein C-terminal domain
MQQIRVPAGSRVFLGAPAKPMEPEIVAAIGRLVDNAPEIIEAHLPQVFVPGAMEAPAQVLVIVTVDSDSQQALEKLGSGLGRIVPPGRSIDAWPLSPDDKLLPTVRAAGCPVGRSPRRAGILRRLRR